MSPEPDPELRYAGRQLIPYLGNKRSLLPRLRGLFLELVPEPEGRRFLDPFSGSGSVSRLARAMGFRVAANDREPYSEALNRCWLCLRPSDLDAAFGSPEAARVEFAAWNRMHPQAPGGELPASARGEAYIARWYAPRDTAAPDLAGERLFYTAENAAFLDSVRRRIDAEFGTDPEAGSAAWIKRAAFLGALILEAATHANTSGVFKAFHHGFGGHGGDALGRILGRMELELPRLVGNEPATVCRMDAAAFASGRPADIAYLDPPYNQHQYGSNYHLLNTLVRWDGLPVPLDRGEDGRLLRKAGIPEAWKSTRSDYCSPATAASSLRSLLGSLDAANIVVSWNGEGFLDAGEMADLLSERGAVRVHALDYCTYRGGRQSASRRWSNREYLYVVDARGSRGSGESVSRILREAARRDRVLRGRYDPGRLSARFDMRAGGVALRPGDPAAGVLDGGECPVFPMEGLRSAAIGAGPALEAMPERVRERFVELLLECVCERVQEDLDALLPLAGTGGVLGTAARKEALRFLRKLAHRKYAADFSRYLAAFAALAPDRPVFLRGLRGLEGLAAKRFGYREPAAD